LILLLLIPIIGLSRMVSTSQFIRDYCEADDVGGINGLFDMTL
jgi:hypothetical protein